MRRLPAVSVLLSLILAAAFAAGAGEQPKSQPIPEKKAIAKAEELVNDIFKDDIAKAADAESRSKLATYLVQQGDESGDDPAARYVLYCQARDLAVLAGNPPLAMSTIEKLATQFDVSRLDLKAEALAKLVNHVQVKEQSKTLTELALALIVEALDADNYDAATALGKLAAEAAKK